MCPAVMIPHNTQTGRWLTPFRAVFDPKDPDEAAVVVGSMGYVFMLAENPTWLAQARGGN
jgi:hypothetical protein